MRSAPAAVLSQALFQLVLFDRLTEKPLVQTLACRISSAKLGFREELTGSVLSPAFIRKSGRENPHSIIKNCN